MEHIIIQGDSEEILKKFSDNSVHLVVTSPPYNVGVKYDLYEDKQDWNDYFNKMEAIIQELYRVLVVGGRVCWNVMINVRKKTDENRINLMQKFKNIFDKYFVDMGDIIWIEETVTKKTAWGSWCSPSSPYIQMPVECILVYAKDSKKLDGDKTDLNKDEFMEWVRGVWKINNNTIGENHCVPFPKELPKRCIKLFSYIGQIVLDPFAGSGTTSLVARELNRSSISIELSENYCKCIKEKLGYGQQQIHSDIDYGYLTVGKNTQNPMDFALTGRLINVKRFANAHPKILASLKSFA